MGCSDVSFVMLLQSRRIGLKTQMKISKKTPNTKITHNIYLDDILHVEQLRVFGEVVLLLFLFHQLQQLVQ